MPMPLIKSLAHACIRSTDLAQTTAFYCGALGMEKVFDFTRQGAVIGFYLRASHESFLEVFQADDAAPAPATRSLHHFCLETERIEETRAALLAAGYAPGEIRTGADQSRQFWVQDPGGVDVEFHEYTARSAQFGDGGNVEVNW